VPSGMRVLCLGLYGGQLLGAGIVGFPARFKCPFYLHSLVSHHLSLSEPSAVLQVPIVPRIITPDHLAYRRSEQHPIRVLTYFRLFCFIGSK
jgi:hypothetical protein